MSKRLIFHPQAMARYHEGQTTAVLPRWVAPPIFTFLWILLLLLITLSGLTWFVQVPVYISGTAVITQNNSNTLQITAFVPANHLTDLQIGQPLFIPFNTKSSQQQRPIIAIQPTLLSPDTIQQQFNLTTITQPSALVTASLDPNTAVSQLGSTYPIEIQVGSQRAISLISNLWKPS